MSSVSKALPARRDIALLWVAVSFLAGCSSEDEAGQTTGFDPGANGHPPNILLVTLDTTRADLFTSHGASKSAAPLLDAFADDCLVFTRAFTTAPMTQPSHTTVLTGLYPYAHGIHDNGAFRLSDDHVTLAEVLHAEGYRTEAFLAATVLYDGTGLAQGFEQYHDLEYTRKRNLASEIERPAQEITDLVLERLSADDGRPYFFWVHYFDPHHPYRAPGAPPESDTIKAYLQEVTYLDGQLARLLDAATAGTAGDHTAVLVTADHGEGLSLGTEMTHGLLLEDDTMRVPMLLRLPGAEQTGTVEHLVSLTDVFPTLWYLVSGERVDTLHGVDLLEIAERARAGAVDERVLYFEAQHSYFSFRWAPLVGFVAPGRRFVRGADDRLSISEDGGKTFQTLTDDPRVETAAAEFEALLDGHDPYSTASRSELSAAQAARLATLGYMATASDGDVVAPDAVGDLPDPRDHYDDFKDFDTARLLAMAGRYAEAVQRMEGIVERHPDNPWFLDRLGRCLMGVGRLDEGRGHLERALVREPNLLNSWYFLGQYHQRREDWTEALRCFDQVIELFPGHYDGRVRRRDVLRRLGRSGEMLLDTVQLMSLVGELDPTERQGLQEDLQRKLRAAVRAVERGEDSSTWLTRAREAIATLPDHSRESVSAAFESLVGGAD